MAIMQVHTKPPMSKFSAGGHINENALRKLLSPLLTVTLTIVEGVVTVGVGWFDLAQRRG